MLRLVRPRVLLSTSSLSLTRSISLPAKPQRTPLYPLHVAPEHKGRMVEFAGWEMPLSYEGTDLNHVAGGPVKEHHQVRNSAGLFDVSHMIQSTYTGPGAASFLSQMLPSSVTSLPVPATSGGPFRSTLSVLLNPEGGIIDDCMLTRWGQESFYLVTNAGRAARDLAWLELNVKEWNSSHKDQVTMTVLSNWGLLALQGPLAHSALSRLLPPTVSLPTIHFGHSLTLTLPSFPSTPLHIARGGYTGEDGFEISLPPGDISITFSEMLLDMQEVKLAGLAARDSLRLEAGLCLYGHDLDEDTGVGEAGLAWVVGKDRREEGGFVGAERTLKELKKGGTQRKRVGLIVEKGAPAREGARIFSSATSAAPIGTVTSGLPSPSVGQNISMGYIQTKDGLNKKGSEVWVEVRGKMRRAEVVAMPFVTPGYYRG